MRWLIRSLEVISLLFMHKKWIRAIFTQKRTERSDINKSSIFNLQFRLVRVGLLKLIGLRRMIGYWLLEKNGYTV